MADRIRARIEERFEAWGRFIAKRPWSVLAASLAIVGVCVAGLPRATIDVSFEAFLGKNDPVLVGYDAFRAQFGRDERVIIAVDRGISAGPDGVFDEAFLERLRDFHEAIEERVPHLDEVTSLVNARDTRGEGDTLLVSDFLDPWPADAGAIARVRERALGNPLFRDNVISEDGSVTTVALELQLYSSLPDSSSSSRADADGPHGSGLADPLLSGFEDDPLESDEPPSLLTSGETAELVEAVYAVMAEFAAPDFVLHAAGSPMLLQDVAASMFRDMPRFFGLGLVSIALLLLLLFRRLLAVVVPLFVVVLSVLSTVGLMGWWGTSIHVPTQLLPSFLLAVGIGDAVHLLAIFFERLRGGDARVEALAHALGHSGLALVMTSVTTAVGLGSFIGSGMAPVSAIGIFAPIGVLIALGLSLSMLPALMMIFPVGEVVTRDASAGDPELAGHASNWLDRILSRLGRFATRHSRGVIAVAALLALLSVGFASQLRLSHDPVGWLPEEAPVTQATRFIDSRLGGSMSFEILLDTGAAGGVQQPETLRRMAQLGESLENVPRDGLVAAQTISLADVVKETHRALNEDRADAYRIPEDPNLVVQELLLFEQGGMDDLEEMTDSEYRTARIAVRMPWRDAVRYGVFFELAQASMQEALGGVGTATVTGILALLVSAISAVVSTMAQSYVLAFGVITPIMMSLLGSWKRGLLAMVPNTLPVLLTLGFMGVMGLPLDGFSLMVGGIALGVAVDDTIHFMHNYARYRAQGMDLERAVEETLQTAGRAMLITTIALSVGFLCFVLSSMQNLMNLGLLVSFAITAAFFADVLLAPALLVWFEGRGRPQTDA